MKKILIVLIFALAISASVFVCDKAFAEAVKPWNVVFTVKYGDDAYSYDLSREISGTDEAEERGFYLGARAKRAYRDRLLALGLPEQAVYNYILPDFDGILRHFDYVNCDREDASVRFDKNGFSYRNGRDGAAINISELFDAALESRGNRITINLQGGDDGRPQTQHGMPRKFRYVLRQQRSQSQSQHRFGGKRSQRRYGGRRRDFLFQQYGGRPNGSQRVQNRQNHT